MAVEIQGADQLARLAKALKDAGNKDLRRELYRAINRSVKPVKDDIRASADTLPSRGGMAAEVKRAKLTTRTRTGREAGVRVVARSRFSLHHLNQGQVRHGPGNKVQQITPGWWDKPTQAAAPDVRRELTEAMDNIVRKLDRAG